MILVHLTLAYFCFDFSEKPGGSPNYVYSVLTAANFFAAMALATIDLGVLLGALPR